MQDSTSFYDFFIRVGDVLKCTPYKPTHIHKFLSYNVVKTLQFNSSRMAHAVVYCTVYLVEFNITVLISKGTLHVHSLTCGLKSVCPESLMCTFAKSMLRQHLRRLLPCSQSGKLPCKGFRSILSWANGHPMLRE